MPGPSKKKARPQWLAGPEMANMGYMAAIPSEKYQETAPAGPAGNRGRGWWRPFFLLAVLVILLVLGQVLGAGRQVEALREWLRTLGPWAPLAFLAIYVTGVVAAFPALALTFVAGALFGSLWGVILVNIGATFGASLAFLIARYFARDAVAHWLAGNDKFQRLDRLTARHGAIIVALTRLVPLFPFVLLNYGFGLTRVPFWTYFFWSWLCTLPETVLYVVGADAFAKALAERAVPWMSVWIFGASLIGVIILVRFARRRLQARQDEQA